MVAFYEPDPSKGADEKTLVKKEATSQKVGRCWWRTCVEG
jgi:hypothetical protein